MSPVSLHIVHVDREKYEKGHCDEITQEHEEEDSIEHFRKRAPFLFNLVLDVLVFDERGDDVRLVEETVQHVARTDTDVP